MTEKIKFTCPVCGKETESDERLHAWMVKNDKLMCSDCFAKSKGANAKKAGSGKSAETTGKKDYNKPATVARPAITAETLRKAYDEVVAEFADVLPDVKEFIGGWTTTIALSKK